jgi:hypothetical protein
MCCATSCGTPTNSGAYHSQSTWPPFDSLRWHLDLPWLRHEGKPFQVTPAQVKADPARYQEQYRRTVAADLGCPLDLLFRNGRWVVLDGIHRLLKADLLGLSTIQVRRLPTAMLPLILQPAT